MGLNSNIKETDWDSALSDKDLDTHWQAFKYHYEQNIEKYVPHKMVKPGQRLGLPWVHYKSIKHAKENVDKAKVKARVSGLNADMLDIQEAKKEVD